MHEIEQGSTFAMRVRAARQVAGLSQYRAAILSGINGSQWWKMERGEWGLDRLYKKFLGKINEMTCIYKRGGVISKEKYMIAEERLNKYRTRLEAIAKVVNCTVEYLVDGTLPPQQESDQETSCNPEPD